MVPSLRRRPRASLRAVAAMVETLERRALLADGITPIAGPALGAVAGEELANVTAAGFTIAEPSGSPGSKWRALIDWGDGQSSKQVAPVQVGDTFQFHASHTYASAGVFTIRTMIAVPGSGAPNDNTVTTQVNVAVSPSPVLTAPPSPTPAPKASPKLLVTFLSPHATRGRKFRGPIARFADPAPGRTSADFTAAIAWGDGTPTSLGSVSLNGDGQFDVSATHRFRHRGVVPVFVLIAGPRGESSFALGSAAVAGPRARG